MASLALNGAFAYTCLKSKGIRPELKKGLGNFTLYNVQTVSKRSSSLLNDSIGAWLTHRTTNVPVRFMSDFQVLPTEKEIDIEVQLMYDQQLPLHGKELADHRKRNVQADSSMIYSISNLLLAKSS